MRRIPALVLLVLVATPVALALPAQAGAYELDGKRWPGRPTARITFHNAAPQWRDAVRAAARAWNASGARVRFVETSRSRARLRIGYMSGGVQPLAHGRATLGYNRGRRDNWVKLPRLSYPEAYPEEMLYVAAHELGHVLGLHHEDRACSLMASGGHHPNCSAPPDERYWNCALLMRDDIAGAARRYGGRARFGGERFCPKTLAPPELLSSRFDAGTHSVIVELRTPNGSHYLMNAGYALQRDACPPAPSDDVSTEPNGSATLTYARLPRGRYCVRLWSYDDHGAVSGRATEAWVDVPADPPPREPPPDDDWR